MYYWNSKKQRSIVPLFLFIPGVVRGRRADSEVGEALKNVSSVFFWKSNLNLLMRFSGTFFFFFFCCKVLRMSDAPPSFLFSSCLGAAFCLSTSCLINICLVAAVMRTNEWRTAFSELGASDLSPFVKELPELSASSRLVYTRARTLAHKHAYASVVLCLCV